ncbi:MAG: tetratricopeptide repeat protein [bacterium]
MQSQSVSTSSIPKLGSIASAISSGCLYLLVFLLPIFYFPWTSNLLEVNKNLVLVVLSVIGGLSWLGSMMAEKELAIRRSPLNVVVLCFVAVTALSTWFSKNTTLSFFGYEGNQYTSMIGLLAFVVMYFLVANSARTIKSARLLFGSFLVSGFFAMLVGLLNMYGVSMPGTSGNFNTIGSAFSLGIYSAALLLLASGFILIESREHAGLMPQGKAGTATRVILWLIAITALIVTVSLDYWVVWTMLIVGELVLLVFALVYPKDFPDMSKFVLPLSSLVIALLFIWAPSPLAVNLPTEVSPSLKGSWTIAKQALRDNPLLGSGPATYIYDYAKYHDSSVNDTIFWNVRFDRANSHAMTLLATTGIFGITLYLLLIILVFIRGLQFILKTHEREPRHMALILLATFAGVIASKLVYASSLTLEFLFWLLLGLIAVAISDATVKKTFPEAPRMSLLLSFCFVLLLVVGVGLTYVTAQHYAADVVFTRALASDQGSDIEGTMKNLGSAVQLNNANDAYFRNLSQANLLMISNVASKPAKDDLEKQAAAGKIVELAKLSVNSALIAKQIGPNNVANWSQLAYIYQNISPFTEGALDEALKAYEEASVLEPSNPVYPTQVGRIYLAQSDDARNKSASKDEKEAATAKALVTELLKKAENRFSAAIELKKDYAPAHYNLSLTYDREGLLKEAIAKMEAVRNISPRDVGVYFQLGLLYYRDGQKSSAEQQFQNAVALSPDYSNALWYLATLAEEKGDTAKALEIIKKVQTLNPDDSLVKARLEKLLGGKIEKPKEIPQPLDNPKGSAEIGGGEAPVVPAPKR